MSKKFIAPCTSQSMTHGYQYLQAFSSAWNATCGAAMPSTMIIPSGKTFLLGPVVFSGPCKSLVHLQVLLSQLEKNISQQS